MRQLRDNPTRPIEPNALPALWRDSIPRRPDWPVHAMTDSMIAKAMEGYYVTDPQTVRLGPLARQLERGTVLYPNDILSLGVVQQNIGRRPIVWAITAGRGFGGLGEYVLQQGLGFSLHTTKPDTTLPAIDNRRLAGAPLDVPTTERLLWDTYHYAGLLQGDVTKLESTSASIASTLSLPFTQLAYAYSARGQHEQMDRALDRAMQLTPNPDLRTVLAELRVRGTDTATVRETPGQ
jgi:hypothetical protein